MSSKVANKENRSYNAPNADARYSSRSIKGCQFQVLDIHDGNHKQGLDALLYWMEAIDALLDEATQNANELKRRGKQNASSAEKSEAAAEYMDSLEECQKKVKGDRFICRGLSSGE